MTEISREFRPIAAGQAAPAMPVDDYLASSTD